MGYKFPIWLIIVAMISTGSLTVSGAELLPALTKETASSNGAITTVAADPGVPTTTSAAYVGVPVHFDNQLSRNVEVFGNGASAGVTLVTSQRIRVDLLMQLADPVTITIPIKNESTSSQLVNVKVVAPDYVMTDVSKGMMTGDPRLVGKNQWMFSVDGDASADFKLHLTSLQTTPFYIYIEVAAVA